MEEKTRVFEALLADAQQAALEALDADQVIALKTACGNTHILKNKGVLNGEYGDEASFLKLLETAADTEILYIVCLWKDGRFNVSVDVPSMHFRQGLLKLNPKNEAAEILLLGDFGYMAKKLIVTMPPKK